MVRRLVLMTVSVLMCGALAAQDQRAVREQLFGETDAVKAQADAVHASMLAPDTYAEAMKAYTAAGETLERGRDLGRVREDVAEAGTLFGQSIERAKLAQVTLASTLSAREAAEKAQAAKLATREWQRAETALVDAARSLEGGNLRGATKDAADVEKRYKEAELKALNAGAAAPAR